MRHDPHALLNVADVSASVAFYSCFGFEPMERFEENGTLIWVMLKAGDSGLMLNLQDRIDANSRRARPHYGDVVFYINVPSADVMRAALVADGIEATPIERQTYGLDEFYVRDPEGYELAIASLIPANG
jgi:uncharacterized glyoxalase superfamily protein PhnB